MLRVLRSTVIGLTVICSATSALSNQATEAAPSRAPARPANNGRSNGARSRRLTSHGRDVFSFNIGSATLDHAREILNRPDLVASLVEAHKGTRASGPPKIYVSSRRCIVRGVGEEATEAVAEAIRGKQRARRLAQVSRDLGMVIRGELVLPARAQDPYVGVEIKRSAVVERPGQIVALVADPAVGATDLRDALPESFEEVRVPAAELGDAPGENVKVTFHIDADGRVTAPGPPAETGRGCNPE